MYLKFFHSAVCLVSDRCWLCVENEKYRPMIGGTGEAQLLF